ncbi:MAG: SDR family oxidoreductase [bacterium]|nr:SDR family oxidoreductase [bacterium]
MSAPARSVLVTGASGFIGHSLIETLADDRGGLEHIVALDVRETPAEARRDGVIYQVGDIRDPDLEKVVVEHGIDTIVHLAAIVSPGKGDTRDFEYSVDVGGTRNVLEASVRHGVRRVIVTSSGAAYGYYADNPEWIHEDDALRGNQTFAYSDHKRLVEEMLAEYRDAHPELEQLIFRPGTILGESVGNQITDIFHKPVIMGVAGSPTPFVFIWDRDVVACLVKGIREGRPGIYNMAGDGAVPLAEIAQIVGKPYIAIPAWLIRGALRILNPLGLSQYGPEQVDFLRYRPVLSNDALKRDFGYTPQKTSREVFDFYWQIHGRG